MDVKGLNGIASPLANRSPPRIYNGNASSPKAPLIAGAYGQAMHPRRCRNEYVWMTEGNALLPPRLHHAPPLENHFLINGKDPAGEPRPEFPVQPMVQFLPKPRILLKLDAVTNLGKSDCAQIERMRGLRIRPNLHFGVGFGFAQFGHDIGVH